MRLLCLLLSAVLVRGQNTAQDEIMLDIDFAPDPFIKHTIDDKFIVDLKKMAELFKFTPSAIEGAIQQQDATTLQEILVALKSVTDVKESCAADLAIFIQSAIRSVLEAPPNCYLQFEHSKNNTEFQACQEQFIEHSQKYAWLYQVLDASGKPGSGLLHGNVLWTGRWDQCRSISADVAKIFPMEWQQRRRPWKGRYCRTAYFISTNPLSASEGSNGTTEFERSQKCFTMIPILSYGTCVSDTCDTSDAERLSEIATEVMIDHGIPICKTRVFCDDYHKSRDLLSDPWTIGVICFTALIAICVLFGSLYDKCIFRRQKKKQAPIDAEDIPTKFYDNQPLFGKVLLSFSAITNTKSIMKVTDRPGDIGCLNGIRVISMFWIILAHTYYYCAMSLTIDNLLSTIKNFPKYFFNQIIVNGAIAVDTFFFLSSFLVCYLWCKRTKKHKEKNITQPMHWIEYAYHRFLRLIPLYMFVLAFHVTVVEYLFSGPFWYPVERERCSKSWWGNLLFLNNFIHLSDDHTCMGWTWYIANDFQFYLFLQPIMMIALYKTKYLGYILGVCILLFTGILHTILIVPKNWPPAPVLTTDPTRALYILDYWPDVYVKPYVRCGPYVVGSMLGYFFFKNGLEFKMSRITVVIGWAINTVVALVAVFGLYLYCKTGEISDFTYYAYALFGRIGWALSLAWIVFACATGHGGPVNAFLSWGVWQPLARLTFGAYLIHPVLIIVYFRAQQTPFHFGTHVQMASLAIGFAFVAYFLSFFVSLGVEQPVGHLDAIVASNQRVKERRKGLGMPQNSLAVIAGESLLTNNEKAQPSIVNNGTAESEQLLNAAGNETYYKNGHESSSDMYSDNRERNQSGLCIDDAINVSEDATIIPAINK